MANNNRHNLRALHNKAQKSAEEQQLRAATLQSGTLTPAQKLMAGLSTTTSCNWNELDGLFTKMAEGIYTFATSVTETYGLLSPYLTDTTSADTPAVLSSKAALLCWNIVKATMSDCEVYSKELAAVKTKHEGKVGYVDKDDLALYYSVGDEYNTLWQKFQTNSYQTTNELTSYLSEFMTAVDKESNLERIVDKAINQTDERKDPA